MGADRGRILSYSILLLCIGNCPYFFPATSSNFMTSEKGRSGEKIGPSCQLVMKSKTFFSHLILSCCLENLVFHSRNTRYMSRKFC